MKVIIIGIILGLLGVMPAAAQECPAVQGARVTCALLDVPENRTRDDSPMIQIAYAVVHSHSESPLPDPLVFIAGGPGNSGIAQMAGMAELLRDVLDTRDLIFFDQRGIGLSQPSLDCTADLMAAAGGDMNVLLTIMLEPNGRNAMAQSCLARYEGEGIDLAAYNTTQAAADLDGLRAALGYEQWNLYGVSYGTLLALNVLRDHPEGVRSAILDSVVPPQVNPFENDEHILDRVFTGCAADWLCNAAYPQLEMVYQQLVADLNTNPLEVNGISINGDTLTLGLATAGSQTGIIPYIPSLIYDLRDGNTSTIAMLLSGMGQIGGLSAMPLVYLCEEEAPFASVQQSGVNSAICGDWQVVDTQANQAVSSDVPVLLMAGEYDTTTPSAWAHLAAETLPNSYTYEFRGSGHVVAAVPWSRCPLDIALAFLDAPTETPDTSCMSGMRGMNFILRAEMSEPYTLIGVAVLGIGVLMPAGYTLIKQRWTLAWRAAFGTIGWHMAVATLATLVIGLFVLAANALREGGSGLPGLTVRLAEVVLTLIIGLQAAFAFAPDDEPSLEIIVACPRPLYYVMLERLTALFVVYGGIGTLAAMLTFSLMVGDNLLLGTARWLAPALLATGIVTRITVLTRRASFGLLVMILLFFATLIGGRLLVLSYPILSPLYPFLQPDEVSNTLYVLNRVFLMVSGLALVVSAAWLTRNEERMLGSGSSS